MVTWIEDCYYVNARAGRLHDVKFYSTAILPGVAMGGLSTNVSTRTETRGKQITDKQT